MTVKQSASRIVVLMGLAGVLIPGAAQAQTAPTSAPTTAPAGRRVMVPAGFHVANLGDYRVLCQDADEPWIRQALKDMAPATRPSTMPVDLLASVQQRRADLLGQLTRDFAVGDATVPETFYDQKLTPALQELAQVRVPIYYLVVTQAKLTQILREGWQDQRFHYNRLTDKVSMSGRIPLNADGPMDDVVVPVVYKEADTPSQRAAKAAEIIRVTDGDAQAAMSARGQFLLQMQFVEFIGETIMKPLKLHDDQQWLMLGVSGVYSCRYASQLTGVPAQDLVAQLTAEHSRNPVKVASIDLLHLVDLSSLREEYVALHVDAVRRKSMLVVDQWVAQAGDQAVPKTLTAMRSQMPADGTALAKLIQEQTGVDLSKDLSAQH